MADVRVEKNRYTVEPLYQWDKDQVLQIHGLSLTSIPEIHFTNSAMDGAIVKQATVDDAGVISVDIPNSILQKPYRVTVYICTYEGESFKTDYSLVIPVEPRNKPNDYTIEVTDEEVYSFNALNNKIDNILILTEEINEKYDQINVKIEQTNIKIAQNHEALSKEIETESTDRELADQNLTLAIQEETTARTQADATEKTERLSGIAIEKAERQAEIAVERARIDAIASLEEGSTTGDAELVDIRVGYDGTTYTNAGEAIRAQMIDVHEVLPEVTLDNTGNLMNKYGSLLANVDENSVFMATYGWDDVPNNESVIFINMRYSTNYNLQIAISINNSGVIYTRIINRNTYTAYNDWDTTTPSNLKIIDTGNLFDADNIESVIQEIGTKLSNISSILSGMTFVEAGDKYAGEFNKLLVNVKDNSFFMANSTRWDDTPNNETVIFWNIQYSTNYNIQIGISVVTSGVIYTRVINRNTLVPFRDWGTMNGTGAAELEPMKVLAVGDSLCSGSRNSNKGFVGDLGLEYKNAGVGMATISNFRTTVTNIPNQLIGVTDFTPDIIIANGGVNDYYYHVPLGEVSATPVTTDEQAEALDRDTVLGGLEYLFYKMIKLYPKAQRFFLITHKTYATALDGGSGEAYWPTFKNNAGYTQQDMHDAFVKCCKAYNVKVIDVYEESLINTLYPEYVPEYVDTDGIHPVSYGYLQGYVPLIKQAIRIGTAK